MKRNGIICLLVLALLALVAVHIYFRRDPRPVDDDRLFFVTTTLDGSEVDESIFAQSRITMVNFFEPWCPPCIAELPELQQLSETYASEDFQLIGVFSTEDGVAEVLEKAGITYPVLHYVPAFTQFQTGYVPTTVFLNSDGESVGEAVIGARSYDQWEEIVRGLLE